MGSGDVVQPAGSLGLRRVLRPLRLQAVFLEREYPLLRARIKGEQILSAGDNTVIFNAIAPHKPKVIHPVPRDRRRKNCSNSTPTLAPAARQTSNLSDRFMHLCNHSVQRERGEGGRESFGTVEGKEPRPLGSQGHMWTADQLRDHLLSRFEVVVIFIACSSEVIEI